MLFRLLALAFIVAAPAVMAQSVPDWAAPTPHAADAAVPVDPAVVAAAEAAQPPPPPPPVPVDGGLALLALAGAGLAARRMRG